MASYVTFWNCFNNDLIKKEHLKAEVTITKLLISTAIYSIFICLSFNRFQLDIQIMKERIKALAKEAEG
jgi:hypothetical protein